MSRDVCNNDIVRGTGLLVLFRWFFAMKCRIVDEVDEMKTVKDSRIRAHHFSSGQHLRTYSFPLLLHSKDVVYKHNRSASQ